MTVPSPIVYSPSQLWHGNDGNWSSFVVRVGTPEQNFYVLPSSATGEIIVPYFAGCRPTDLKAHDCATLRGVFDMNQHQGFLANASKSWQEVGFYGMLLESKLGYADNASYGIDNVGLMLQNSGGPTLKDQVVGSVRKMPFFVGFFGLSPKASNFTDFDNPQRSYLTTLRDEGLIPSLSFAYSAGAAYRSPKVPGSLTLGGFEKSRFEPNSITFPFDQDDERRTSLKLQQITANNTFNRTVSILHEETYVNLDFTLPYLWLPRDTCDRIAASFKLQYDNTTDLYLVDDDTHTDLVARNPFLTFTFGDSLNSAQRVNIALPYAAFDLQASWPIFNNTRNYFPIRRANTSSQYTLGRAFMQEAYIIVDYERGNFSLHQAAFPASSEQKIVSIPAKDARHDEGPHHLSKAEVSGIVIGSTVFVALVMLLGTLVYRRRKQSHVTEKLRLEHWGSSEDTQATSELPENSVVRSQLMSTEILEVHVSAEHEADGKSRSELA